MARQQGDVAPAPLGPQGAPLPTGAPIGQDTPAGVTNASNKKVKESKQQTELQHAEQVLEQTLGVSSLVGGTGGAVNLAPNSEAGASVPLATNAHAWLLPDKGAKQTGHTYSTSLEDLMVSLIEQDGKDNGVVERLARDLQGIGYLPQTYNVNNTVQKTMMTAFEALAKQAAASNVPLMTLLQSGSSARAQQLMAQNVAYTRDINSELASAVGGSVVTQPLDDPNYVRQTFASAMESMGMGTPSQQQSNQFLHAFLYGPQGQVAARQAEADTQKEDVMASVGDLRQARLDVQGGNTQGAAALLNKPGPDFVATRASPNLDAEAVAAAKDTNPAEYYATGASYLGGILNQMIQGSPNYQTASESPTSQSPGGGITGSPIAGAP